MSDTHMPPPLPSGAPTSVKGHATNMARNVTVSVLSTVIGASMIWLLGFNHGSSDNFLEMKQATTLGWKSYVASDNTYYQNILSHSSQLIRDKKLDIYKENMLKEIHAFQSDLADLRKTKNMDPSFVSLLKRRADAEKVAEGIFTDFVDHVNTIINSGKSQDEVKQELQTEQADFNDKAKGVLERAVNEAENLSKALTEKYSQPFLVTDFLAYQAMKKEAGQTNGNETNNNNNTNTNNRNDSITNPNVNAPVNNTTIDGSTFVGEWDTNNTGLDLNKDGSMYWAPDSGSSVSGTWRFDNSQLYMYPKATAKIPSGTIWIFNLSNVTPNSFTMKLANQPNIIYYLIRSQGN